MSRQLPEKPNLEHLKKQAKELLRSMPESQLADAQSTLPLPTNMASPSWPKLKLHVESLVNPADALRTAVCGTVMPRIGPRASGSLSGAAVEN